MALLRTPDTATRRGVGALPGLLANWFTGSWEVIDRDRAPGGFAGFEAGLLVVAAVGLAVMRFPAQGDNLARWLGPDHPWHSFAGQLQWSLFAVVGYVAIPVAYLKATGRRLARCNLRWSGTGRHLPVYAALAALMIVPILVASVTSTYRGIYPLYGLAGRSWADFLAWQAIYAAQFVALEFFFRGFLVEGLRRPLGHGAIFVMVVPYCTIHFSKSLSESLAAIVAGVVLGTMAMRWRSIWGGALLHIWVAVAMDVAVLTHTGGFPPSRWLP